MGNYAFDLHDVISRRGKKIKLIEWLRTWCIHDVDFLLFCVGDRREKWYEYENKNS